eukprot:XP_019076770.1 PREDICTED: DNA repair protein XRCC2 homolog isoform X3 [Vitis vinifera]
MCWKLHERPPNFNNNNRGWRPNGEQQQKVQGQTNLTNINLLNDENETQTHGEFKEDIERLKRLLRSFEKPFGACSLSLSGSGNKVNWEQNDDPWGSGTEEPNIGYDEELFAACMRRFLYIRCYDSFEFLATLKTLRYRLQRARETHGVTAHFLMIDSIGAFYWVDRASTSLHLESNSRKRLSLQSISETVVEEIRKLLLVHPMLVLATKATILGDTYSTNEVKRTSMKLSSNDPSNLRTVTGGPQKLSYREFMPLVWQSFVTHRILVRAADDDPANSKYQSRSIFLSEWLMPSLNFSDKFIVRDAGVFVVS